MVMTSFNTVNGVPATGNKKLMRGILRDEMGFDGVLISDWAAIEEIIYHGYCADREEAAVRSAEAGVDIDMMTGIYCENLCRLVREGKISEDLIDESCMRILELKNKLGLFENPYKDADETKEKEVILCKEHRDLAREAARKSFVLLKNGENPASWQGEEDCLGRTVCPQQKPDGLLVLHRRCKGCDKSGRGRKSAGRYDKHELPCRLSDAWLRHPPGGLRRGDGAVHHAGRGRSNAS